MSDGVDNVNGYSPEDLTSLALALNKSFEPFLVELDGVVLSNTGSELPAILTHLDDKPESVRGWYQSEAVINNLYLDNCET